MFVYPFVDNTEFGNNEFSLKAHTKKHQTECVGEDEFIMNLLFFENSNILSSKIAYIRSYIRTVYSINRAHAFIL